ncbi:MAG TPA: DUF86 domain-containing protein [Candidatus Binatia bacterium]|nr:DUF86 domain-containing protein [Candidatus Binatia bacterium]
MSRDDATLLDMLKAARLVVEFKGKLTKKVFLRDVKTQSAILHQLLVIGEAVKRLSEDFRAKHAEISWIRIAGMRDKLIHHYDAVDLDEVWKTVTKDIAPLISFLERLVTGHKVE